MAETRDSRAPQNKRLTLVGGVFNTLMRLVAWAAISLFISICIEWIGMSFFWEDEGLEHSAAMVQTEYRYLAISAEKMPLVGRGDRYMEQALSYADAATYWLGFKWLRGFVSGEMLDQPVPKRGSGVFGGNFDASDMFNTIAGGMGSFVAKGLGSLGMYIQAAINIVHVFVLRVFILILAIPAFWLFGSVGVARGLVGRELRKWCGGRESSGVYHLYLALLPNVTIGLWALYLALPVSVNPILIVAPIVILFSLVVSQLCLRFKKYV